MNPLEVKNIVKSYDKTLALSDVSFSMKPGEIFGLLGPNGAGKSTLINIISGLITKDSGEVFLGGYNLDKQMRAAKSILGVVPQELAIYPDLSGRANVQFFGSLYGLSGSLLKESVEEVLEFVGLTDRASQLAKTYSGGMKRRLNMACGMVHRPKLLILDEPTVGIDPQSRNHILEALVRLNAEGMDILYTTHYMEEAQSLCRRIAIVDQGQLIAQGSLSDLRGLVAEKRIIELSVSSPVREGLLETIEGVSEVTMSNGSVQIKGSDSTELIKAIIDTLHRENITLRDLRIEEINLEDIFLTLTGRTLRD